MKRMTMIKRWLALLVLILAGCNQEGVGSFASNNSRVSIVTNSARLYTSDVSGGDVHNISTDVYIGYGSSLSPFGDRIVYMENSTKNIVSKDSRADAADPATALIAGSENKGLVTFIPSGEVLFYILDGAKYSVRTLSPNDGTVSKNFGNLDQVFLTQASFKPKLDSSGAEFITRPYGSGNFALVATSGAQASLYVATGTGLSDPAPLARTVNVALQSVFAGRNQADISSGVVSNDGHKLVLRTETGDPKVFSLYAVDLDNDSDPLQLVTNWNTRPEFSFAPEGHEVTFECPDAGGSVCLYNFDTGQRTVLRTTASSPLWVPAP